MDKRHYITGYPVDTLDKDSCVKLLASWATGPRQEGGARYFVCANPHSLEVARVDDQYKTALLEAHLIVADGVGIVVASRLLGGALKERVTGSDLFEGLSHALSERGGARYFFLGASEDTLNKIQKRLAIDYPLITVAGTLSPPYKDSFSEEEDQQMCQAINTARPDVLWVGMTAPKQEKWIKRNLARLDVALACPVGAVFDFYSGKVKRPHPIFLDLGLEWLVRLMREPIRLWRRTFVSNPLFMFRVLWQKFRG